MGQLGQYEEGQVIVICNGVMLNAVGISYAKRKHNCYMCCRQREDEGNKPPVGKIFLDERTKVVAVTDINMPTSTTWFHQWV